MAAKCVEVQNAALCIVFPGCFLYEPHCFITIFSLLCFFPGSVNIDHSWFGLARNWTSNSYSSFDSLHVIHSHEFDFVLFSLTSLSVVIGCRTNDELQVLTITGSHKVFHVVQY